MSKTSLNVTIHVTGIREILRALSVLPKDVQDGIRDESLKLAQKLAGQIKADGMSDAAPQSKIVAETVKAKRDRVPVVEVGGTRKIGRNKTPAYKLLFGSVFGSNAYEQFHRPHLGQEGYWVYPTLIRQEGEIIAAWNKVADDAVRNWSAG